jgi:DNA topoisomerase-1
MRERRERAQARVIKYRQQVKDYRAALKDLRVEAREKTAAASDKRRPKVRERYKKRIAVAKRRIKGAQGRLARARLALGKVESRNRLAARGREWNLGTSLKSYIDPRVYTRWGQEVEYDVLERYYPKLLRSKFAWAAVDEEEE